MHELSIAMSIADAAAEEARSYTGTRVCAVHLRLGDLSGVVKDALLFSWDASCEGTALSGVRLVIEETPGKDLEVSGLEIEDI
jgi:hydrogenase nickel incorporation protein HypA/HybF